MTLKSALQDVRETTLAAVSGLLGKLLYLASLRRVDGAHQHWGMALVHGPDAAERALKQAHGEVLAGVLRAPLASLTEDLEETSRDQGVPPEKCVVEMRGQFTNLVLAERRDSPEATHLSSVLTALSHLEQNRERATPSTS
ncbi:MAG TPA: hypothetical protein VKR60_05595 [Candidatus Sulfotelmatobacter sp.]|nr:hypothetical protein [Candidatus Sulfotelmatobacter sp.]